MTGATAECRGGSFRYAFDPVKTETWWTFQDEADIRERWWHIHPGDVVLDVGVDMGSYTLPALAAGAAHCYTWSINWLELFSINIAANGWQDKVSMSGYGLWSEGGWLTSPPGVDALSFSKEQVAGSFRVETLDDAAIFWDLKRADWLKIDVEGAEFELLKGAANTIQALKPKILIELHKFKDQNIIHKCDDLLSRFGYYQDGIVSKHDSVSHGFYLPRVSK